MRDRSNPNAIGQLHEEYDIGKSPDMLFPQARFLMWRTSRRIPRKNLNCTVYLSLQIQAQSQNLPFIPLHCCVQFPPGSRMDDDRPHEYFFRSSADAFSQGSPCAVPSRISCSRRFNSASHNRSASASTVSSRDKIKKCAISARSAAERPANCDLSFSAATDIRL